ncbi:TPA: hypothetical protein N0H24_006089 [Pseudomonas aeruginosa]|nr:hypothetical protein [Pseudomonas aeruginosa]
MNKANECTCPSGDGSLVHPCPAHPAVDQADVAAKLTFINGRPAMCGCQVEYSDGGGEYSDVIYVTLCAKHSGSAILDLVATNRIALTPEYEGQWHADLYLDREIPLAKVEGATPAEAVLALMSAERIDPEQESVEQAGGDERAAFFKHLIGRHPAHETEIVRVVEHNHAAWKAWQARAALAQPSPVSEPLIYACKSLAQITSSDGSGHADLALAVLRMAGVGDDERERLVNEWKAARAWKPAPAQADEKPGDSILCYGCFAKGVGPDHFDEAGKCLAAQAEQAEAERPEGPTEDELEAAGLGYPLHKEEAVKLWYSGFRSEVITVLEAWEAIGHDIGMNPDKGELLDSLRYMLEKCEAHDAALAEVAGLRSLLNSLLCYVERDIDRMRSDRDKSDNKEIYDRSISLAMERLKAAQNAVFTTEPGCDTAVELAAQTTQAQHSVPDGWVQSLPLKDHQPCKSNEDRANGYVIPIYSRPVPVEEALRKLRAVLCDPVGNVVIDGSDGDREEVQRALGMLAAAPAQGGE